MALANFASLTPTQQEHVLDSPALQPPPGVQPNFYDPPNMNHIVYPTIISALFLSSIFILLRIHGRWYCMKTVRFQDFLGIIGFLLFVAELAIVLEQIRHPNALGIFVHEWNMQIRNLRSFFLRVLIITNLYSGIMLLLKTAILSDWLQIFSSPGNRGAFYWACIATITVNTLYGIIGIVLLNLQCTPLPAIYDKTIQGRCLYDQKTTDVFAGSFNVTIDVIILALPQGVIWKLRMSSMRRLGLSFVFAVGLLACTSSGARLVFSIMNMYSDDVTYSYSLVGLCTFAEVTCGFIVFSVTAIPRSFASFKRSKLVLRLKLQYSSITEVSNGLQPHQARWQNTKPISSESDASTEIDAHTCEPLGECASREALTLQRSHQRGGDEECRHDGILRTVDITTSYQDIYVPRQRGVDECFEHPTHGI